MQQPGRSNIFFIILRIYALLLLIIGLVLAFEGARLVQLGGSFYYVLAGLALILTAVLLWKRSALGASLYAAFFLVTVVWAIWEAGLDPWALMPRLALLGGLGLWLLVPGTARSLGRQPGSGAGLLAIGIVAAVAIGWGLHASTGMEIPDPAYKLGTTAAEAPVEDASATARSNDWLSYGNDAGGSRFSPLKQITPANVDKLQVAWQYRAGALPNGTFSNIEATPIKVGQTLYVCTAFGDVIALDADKGSERWRYHSDAYRNGFPYANCRGVTYYRAPGVTGPCAERIVSTKITGQLIALDAATGELCADFGDHGQVSLLTGMGNPDWGYYFVTSAPTIVHGKIVLGGWVADGQYWNEPSGVIRAWDAVTGKFVWAFDVGHLDRTSEPPPGETYTPSTPNSWAPMSADEDLGLVYAPTGNTSGSDYFGGIRRPFDDQFSTSVVAIDADTGKLRWSFQTIHHDVWDYDLPAQPSLVDIPGPSGVIKALIQPTKRGELFLLDRVTGKPIADVADKPVPQNGAVPEERLSPTQPFSVGMPPLTGPNLTEAMMWGLTPVDQLLCRIQFKTARYDGAFTPPGLTKNLVYPGYGGGMNWGGVSIDSDRKLLVVNTLRVANQVRLITRAEADRLGAKPMSTNSHSNIGGTVAQAGTPYGAEVGPFLSPIGMPCQQPPFGMISAIDLTTHKLIWTRPFGTGRDAGPFGISSHLPLPMGMTNFGGSITTRSGLVFISATKDADIRAFDTATGKMLWQTSLPAGGNATPMTYVSPASGKQYVAIAASGHFGVLSTRGDYIIAYSLPDEKK